MVRINKPLFITIVDLRKPLIIVTEQNFLTLLQLLTQTIKIENIYIICNEIAVIKSEKGNNQMEAKIAKGIRQECNLSLLLVYQKPLKQKFDKSNLAKRIEQFLADVDYTIL